MIIFFIDRLLYPASPVVLASLYLGFPYVIGELVIFCLIVS